ncbi:MAG: hypothetical protein PWP23_1538 [Candidatus Sumerlaeota bacterium]|nr:hypothetical protein [Candidatus Sumerlaeota bacterium]
MGACPAPGVPLRQIARLMGHADTRVTEQNNVRLAKDEAADAVEKLPVVG